jgi:hypothetical protein
MRVEDKKKRASHAKGDALKPTPIKVVWIRSEVMTGVLQIKYCRICWKGQEGAGVEVNEGRVRPGPLSRGCL